VRTIGLDRGNVSPRETLSVAILPLGLENIVGGELRGYTELLEGSPPRPRSGGIRRLPARQGANAIVISAYQPAP